jgi:APA family basic amino acid/polyamine antiporter
MVGIIIGSSFYVVAPAIAANVSSPGMLILAWVCGGLFALCGALCYAELASALPEDGGEYVYLGRAYGPRLSFLYAWAVLWVIRPGTIGGIAFVFAQHAQQLFPLAQLDPTKPSPFGVTLYAIGIVLLLTAVNMFGVRPGTRTQNVLSVTKTVGLLAVVAAAFWHPAVSAPAAVVVPNEQASFGLAMILILYAFGGWSDMPMIAAEVRDPDRNLFRALVLGTLVVTAIYLLVNLACLYSLGFAKFRETNLIAVELVRPLLGATGERLIAALVCVTAAGALNGMIFTGARVSYALGQDHRWFAPLARWSDRYGGPLVALAAQTAITLVLIRFFGRTGDGFRRLVDYTTPVFFTFFLLTGVALAVLRYREPNLPRPFRTPGFPVTWLIFCLSSAFMLYSSINYAISQFSQGNPHEAMWAGGVMLAGLVLCAFSATSESSTKE